MKNVLYVLLGVIAGFVLAGMLVFVARRPAGNAIVLETPSPQVLAVHVIGAVPRPGVYDFERGARVQDAVRAAGGLLSNADDSAVNLAAPLEDGQQLNIPFRVGGNASDASAAQLPAATSGSGQLLLNINIATIDQLDSLPGIGPTTAKKILDYRAAHGPFASIDEIQNVPGIGPATFDAIKDLITV